MPAGLSLNRNELKELLPGLGKTNSENYYITNYLMDAWALLTVIGQISVKIIHPDILIAFMIEMLQKLEKMS